MRNFSASACALALGLIAPTCGLAASTASIPAAANVPYGTNKAASGSFAHDGVTLYYEIYGAGEPLLIVHGNGGSIVNLAAQIAFFKGHRRVIVMDSRDQGRSGDSAGPLTYEKMADDLAALLDHLSAGPVDVLGWSDGGIEALLMGLRHPDKIRKLVVMAANLNPEGLYPETEKLVKDIVSSRPAGTLDTPEGRREAKASALMLAEPHIDFSRLKTINAPTLVLSGDHDLVRLNHTVAIFEALPNAQLAVLPNSTHLVPYDDPQTFNATVERFLATPFRKKDRIPDTVASFERMMGAMPRSTHR